MRPLLIAAPCVIAAAWLSLLWWTKVLFGEFGCVTGSLRLDIDFSQLLFDSWAIFHIVGANPAMKGEPSLLHLFL